MYAIVAGPTFGNVADVRCLPHPPRGIYVLAYHWGAPSLRAAASPVARFPPSARYAAALRRPPDVRVR